MDKYRLILSAGSEDEGARLDAFIGYNADELSRSYAVKLIEQGLVSVGGSPVTSKKYKVCAGDEITIEMPERMASRMDLTAFGEKYS